jgi:hypothetical protein
MLRLSLQNLFHGPQLTCRTPSALSNGNPKNATVPQTDNTIDIDRILLHCTPLSQTDWRHTNSGHVGQCTHSLCGTTSVLLAGALLVLTCTRPRLAGRLVGLQPPWCGPRIVDGEVSLLDVLGVRKTIGWRKWLGIDVRG